MSVNIKQNGDLIRVANNVSIVQADWNDKDNPTKGTCIKNQPDTLKTLDEIAASTDENALAGAAAVKELLENGGGIVGSIASKIICTCNGEDAVGVTLTGTINGKVYKADIGTDNIATFMIPDVGNFVITGTEEYYVNHTVVIEYFSIYEIDVTPTTVDTWIAAAGLTPSSYATLDALLEDEAAIRILMTKKASVDALAKMSLNDNLKAIIKHRYVAKWINYREYAYNTLSTRESIKALMDESGMYGMYITTQSKLQPLVPVLTSNTGSDGGEASASNPRTDGSYEPFRAFDNDESTRYEAINNSSTKSLLKYKFVTPTCVKRLYFILGPGRTINVKVVASNDGNTWTTLKTANDYSGNNTVTFENNDYYLYYGLDMTPVSGGNVAVTTLQFYGYQLEALIPTMTSNTSPSGEASASGEANTSYQAWKAFDNSDDVTSKWLAAASKSTTDQWLMYEFPKAITAKSFSLVWAGYMSSVTYSIQASNDNSKWNNLTESISDITNKKNYLLNNDASYKYYRVFIHSQTMKTTETCGDIVSFQLYGEKLWEPKGLVPVMTSKTAPYGEVKGSSNYDSNQIDVCVFDNDTTYSWASQKSQSNEYLYYKFVVPTCVKQFDIAGYQNASVGAWTARKYSIDGSHDGIEWTPLGEFTEYANGLKLNNDEYYLYYRFYSITNGDNGVGLQSMQYYGRQLEALIPPMTSNTTPIGEVFASTINSSTYDAYKAFDGVSTTDTNWRTANNKAKGSYIGCKFNKPVLINGLYLLASNSNESDNCRWKDFVVEASNDGDSYTELYSTTYTITASATTGHMYTFENDNYYFYYRIRHIVDHYRAAAYPACLNEVQFYGTPDYESRTYIYDHGVEVMEVTAYVDKDGTVTKTNDNLLVEIKNQVGIGQFYAFADLTNHSVVCTEIDSLFVDLMTIQIRETTPITTSTWSISNALAGYSISAPLSSTKSVLDISSVNDNKYIILATGGATSAVNRAFSVSTLWLE